jgi:hypothetical protein
VKNLRITNKLELIIYINKKVIKSMRLSPSPKSTI